MFNLIVAVISIALIAAMAAASIFYGGSAFSSGTAQAAATTLVNNGQQISGAQQLYMIDNSGNLAADIATLATNGEYLQAAPTPPSMADGTWSLADSGALGVVDLNDLEAGNVCAEVAEQGGIAAGTLATPSAPVASDLVDAEGADVQFGCVNFDGSGDLQFVYKL